MKFYYLLFVLLSYPIGQAQNAQITGKIVSANKTHCVGGHDHIRLFPGAPRN